MDFLYRIKEHIETLDLFEKPINVGLLMDGDNIAIRSTPSSPEDRYADGSKIIPYSFQILVKHANQQTAIDTTESISKSLDGLTNGAITSSDGSFIFNKCEAYTTPNFVNRESSGEWIYTAMFQAELLI